MLASGLIMLTACKIPTVEVPVDSCVTSKQFQLSKCGQRNLDFKKERSTVGEWVDISKLEEKPLDEMEDQVCFSLESWLTKIKPRLKEGSDSYHNKQ